YKKCRALFESSDIAVYSAAIADYKPMEKTARQIKKDADSPMIRLKTTQASAAPLDQLTPNAQFTVGFARETDQEEDNAIKNLESKNFDLIVLNSLNDTGAGFAHDTNQVTIIDWEKKFRKFELNGKKQVADDIVDAIVEKPHA